MAQNARFMNARGVLLSALVLHFELISPSWSVAADAKLVRDLIAGESAAEAAACRASVYVALAKTMSSQAAATLILTKSTVVQLKLATARPPRNGAVCNLFDRLCAA